MFRRYILIGLLLVGGLEYLFCHMWQVWLQETITFAGMTIIGMQPSELRMDCLYSAGGLMVIWLVLLGVTTMLKRPRQPSIMEVGTTILSVLIGSGLSALLCLSTTAQFLVQNALADPTGEAMFVSSTELSLVGWNIAGGVSGALFAVCVLGVRQLLRDDLAPSA